MQRTQDRRFFAAPFWLSFTMPAVTALGIAFGGPWIVASPVLLFGIVPLADTLVGHDTSNPNDTAPMPPGVDVALFGWLAVQLVMIGTFVARVGAGAYSAQEVIGLSLTVGLSAGAGGINVAHELMHRSSVAARVVAEVLMTSVSYPHFCVEHVHGHHRHVATPLDPASSRRGESLFAFWVRTLVGGLRSAWRIESERVRTGRGRGGLLDRRVRFSLMLLAVYAVVWMVGGPLGIAAFAGQSVVAVLLLETINYIEHYGLQRREIAPGRYERVRPEHSWNASQRVTNWYLFNLQRHSDHHYRASRPYWELRHHDGVPQLPFSYPTAFLAALVPPLWRRIMDPRVDAWSARASSREDITT